MSIFELYSEKLFKSIAEEMVAGGYSAAGYDRINIDDCWMSKERIDGKLAADKDRFPQGIPHLVKYVRLSATVNELPIDFHTRDTNLT